MKITHAEFIKSAFKPAQYPPAELPEVVFAGRSNVGKSSLINRLLNRRKLARTSSTPGRTQAINFFAVNNKVSFVDLPGYGYAKVPRDIQQQWKPMVESYLQTRTNLKLAVVIVDIRRTPGDDDRALTEWLEHYGIPFLVVLTKTDKIKKNQRVKQHSLISTALGLADNQTALFSAQTGEGRDEIWRCINTALQA